MLKRVIVGVSASAVAAIVGLGGTVASDAQPSNQVPFEALSYCGQLDAIATAGKSVSEFVIASGQFDDYAWAVRSECNWHQEQLNVANSVLYPQPVTAPSTVLNATQQACDPSYPGLCLNPSSPDLDCSDIGARNFRVVGSDPHGFDRDRDGIGCEE